MATQYNEYYPGNLVRIDGAFTDSNDAPADPSTVVLKVKDPTGATTTYTQGVDPDLIKDNVGFYHLDLQPTLEGVWHYRWEGSGAIKAAGDGRFYVKDSVFVY